MRPCILHIKQDYFLPISETFIYNSIINIKRYIPVVITQEVKNVNLFPYDKIELLQYLAEANEEFTHHVMDLKKKYNPLLIHAHFGPFGVYGLILKSILNIPLITSFYGWDSSAALKEEYCTINYTNLFNECDFFVCLSKYMHNQLRNGGCPEEKIRIIRLGVDLNRFVYKPRLYPHNRKLCFLTVGRLVKKKGMDDTIRAFSLVNKIYPTTELKILGQGPLRPMLESLAKEFGVEDQVMFMGECTNTEVKEQMQKSDIFVLASKTAKDGDQEGTPVVIQEALSSGLPVVTTRHAGIPEVVMEGVSGFLVPEGDAQALADRMVQLIKHPESWCTMGDTGRRHIEQNFNIVTETRKLENLYDEVIKNYLYRRKPNYQYMIRSLYQIMKRYLIK